MRAAENLSQVLWVLRSLNILACALVVWRLYASSLHRTYRLFFAYVMLQLARSVVLLPLSSKGVTYYRIWVITQPLLWLLYVLVVFELYSLVWKQYRGIYSLGRWFLVAAVSMSVLLSALAVFPTVSSSPGNRPEVLYYAGLIERGVVTSLALFLLLLLALVTWFPVPLSRNLLTHCCVYSAYFFANNVTALYWYTGSRHAYWGSVFKLGVALACFSCWVFFLCRAGETRIASLQLGRSPLQEKRLLGQLETLNATLLRTARK